MSVFLYILCTFCKSQKVSLYRSVRLQDSVVQHFAHFLFCFIFSFSPRLWFSKRKSLESRPAAATSVVCSSLKRQSRLRWAFIYLLLVFIKARGYA